MRDYHEDLQASTVYIYGPLSIHFDGVDTFTVFDCDMATNTFWHNDIISMQHARDVAERYIRREYL